MLDFQNISIYRKGEKVLDHFNLKAPDGVILALERIKKRNPCF